MKPFSNRLPCAILCLLIYSMLPIMCDETLDVEYDDSLDSSNEVRTELNNPPITSVNQFGGVSNNIDTSRTLSEEAEEEIKNLDPKYTYTGANNVSSNAAKDRNGSASGSEDDEDYVYEYDIDLSHSSYNWAELVPTLIVYGATMVVGIAGNSLIIFTICRYRRMKSTTNVFLASLASADLLLIIICIPVKVAKLFSYTWTMGFHLCKGVHYLQNVSAICSVLTLTAMSIERYYAIVHPMKAKYMCTISQARKIVLGIWIASFLLAVPNLISQEHSLVSPKYNAYYCVQNYNMPTLWRFHEVYMLSLILIIPTCIMVVAYGSISWEIWHVMQRRYDMTSGQALNPTGGRPGVESFPLRYRKRLQRGMSSNTSSFRDSVKKNNSIRTEEENNTVKQVIKMLVAVVVLFVLCWAPLLIMNVLYAYEYYNKYNIETKNFHSAFTVMAYSNSCINPLVYGFMSKNFRESFYKALCRCCYKGGRVPRRHLSVSQTRTTSVRFGRSVSVSTAPY